MEYSIYNNMSVRPKKSVTTESIPVQDLKLEHLCQLKSGQELDLLGEDKLAKAYCNDLRDLLHTEGLEEMITGLMTVEQQLSQLHSMLASKTELMLPSMMNFYKNLSPLLLRAAYETGLDDLASVKHGWIEAIRVALEDEIVASEESVH